MTHPNESAPAGGELRISRHLREQAAYLDERQGQVGPLSAVLRDAENDIDRLSAMLAAAPQATGGELRERLNALADKAIYAAMAGNATELTPDDVRLLQAAAKELPQ